jgi:hypothetical protein
MNHRGGTFIIIDVTLRGGKSHLRPTILRPCDDSYPDRDDGLNKKNDWSGRRHNPRHNDVSSGKKTRWMMLVLDRRRHGFRAALPLPLPIFVWNGVWTPRGKVGQRTVRSATTEHFAGSCRRPDLVCRHLELVQPQPHQDQGPPTYPAFAKQNTSVPRCSKVTIGPPWTGSVSRRVKRLGKFLPYDELIELLA